FPFGRRPQIQQQQPEPEDHDRYLQDHQRGVHGMGIPKRLRPGLSTRGLADTIFKNCDTDLPLVFVTTPLGLWYFSGRLTQGSSFLATLGFEPESLWDWVLLSAAGPPAPRP